jgi:hypothetical protein
MIRVTADNKSSKTGARPLVAPEEHTAARVLYVAVPRAA